jgi:type IV pilus assembly protein PilX
MLKLKMKLTDSPHLSFKSQMKTQQGVVMIIALIVLIAMSLAGVALVRSVDTTNLLAGNIAFKQGALQEGNTTMETAINMFAIDQQLYVTFDTQTKVEIDIPAQNYHASMLPANSQGIPLTLLNAGLGVSGDFDNNPDFLQKISPADARTQNKSRFVIERLCFRAGPADSEQCRFVPGDGSTHGRGQTKDPGVPLYRITTRVDGPNNTVSYTQAVISPSTTPGI